MPESRPFRYVATFQDPRQAEEDFAAVSALHRAGLLGTFGAALITRDASGAVRVRTRELPAERGAVLGAVLGALTGRLLHLPLLVSVPLGLLAGGLIGHVRAGLPRRALHTFARTLGRGESAVVVVGHSRLEEAFEQATRQAQVLLARRLGEVGEVNRQFREAARRAGA